MSDDKRINKSIVFGLVYFFIFLLLAGWYPGVSVFAFVSFLSFYMFWKGFRLLKQKKFIEETPTSKIRSLAMGPVEVSGRVVGVPGKIMKSPEGRDCVYYKYRRMGILEGCKQNEFMLKDDTGSIIVDPRGADVTIPKYMFAESLIAPGDRMYVLGSVMKTAAADKGKKQGSVIKKGTGNMPFYISRISEKELVDVLLDVSYAYFVAGFLGLLINVSFLLVGIVNLG